MLKRLFAFLSLTGLLAGFIALASCGGNLPFPIPTPPPPTPSTGWDCDNEPELSGEVAVRVSKAANENEVESNVWRKPFVAASAAEARLQAGRMAQAYGAKRVLVLADGKAFAGVFDKAALAKLQAAKDVQFYHRVVPMKAIAATKLPGLDRIGQRDLPLNGQTDYEADGAGTALVTNDTGVYFDHDAFKGRMQAECKTVVTFGGCNDRHGHGTHVTGTAAGTTYGVQSKSIIYAGRSLDENGSGTDTGVAEVLDWTGDLAGRNRDRRFVTNLSLGGSYSPTINKAVCLAREKNVVVVVAAGNDYSQDACEGSPSGVKQALTVGAMDPRNDNVADFSNAGKCVDLYAPGVDIESAWNTGGTNTISGTSMATPHVAGAALQYLSKHPRATVDQVHDAIVSAATNETLNRVPGGTANRMLFVELR